MIQKILTYLQSVYTPEQFEQIKKGLSTPKRASFRVNTNNVSVEKVVSFLDTNNIEYRQVWDVSFLTNTKWATLLRKHLTQNGSIYFQSLSSQLPVQISSPTPNDVVLDTCAAPGSKTSQLSALMQNKWKIIAVEQNFIRYQKLLNTLKIQNCTNVIPIKCDILSPNKEIKNKAYTKILVDVPCGGIGTINLESPKSYEYLEKVEDYDEYIQHKQSIQVRILEQAISLLEANWELVYSTCSIDPRENEEVVQQVLEKYPNLTVLDIDTSLLPKNHKKNSHWVTILPNQNWEGFYICKLRKVI